MKILFTANSWDRILGGKENATYEIVTRLSKYNCIEPHLLLFGKPKDKISNKIKLHSLFKLPNTIEKIPYCYNLLKPLYLPSIKSIIKRYDFDLIYISDNVPWGYFLKSINVKKVLRLYGSDIYPPNKFFLTKNIFIKPSIQKMDKLISPSKWLSDYCCNYYNKKSTVIHTGIDLNLFKPLKVKREKNIILYAGRLIKLKGIFELLEVAKELKSYEFLFVGDGPLKGKINLPNTEYLGLKTKEELAQLYNKATICVFPSHYDNFPNVCLEAMACGTPVIGTRFGFEEIIDHMKNGINIDPKNTAKLKEAIIKLMENKGLQKKFSKNGLKKIKQFSWDIIAKKYYSNLKEIIKNEK